MGNYVKLFGSILQSTIWQESKETRLVWITLLALKDARQIAEGSIPGLARTAGVTIPECEEALKVLMAPDSYSRNQEHEGRRIEKVDGGWRILNGERYQQKMSAEQRREYNRIWAANKREVLREARKKAERQGRTEGVILAMKAAEDEVMPVGEDGGE